MAESVRFGQVVWVTIADHNGISKSRPVVIVTPNDDIVASGMVDVVAITSSLPTPIPDDHVMLPWHPQGHPRTRLNRKCAAVCSWVVQVSVDDIQSVVGSVTGSALTEILNKIRSKPIQAISWRAGNAALLGPGLHVPVGLEATYQATWNVFPEELRELLNPVEA